MSAELSELRARIDATLAEHREALRAYSRAGGLPRRILVDPDAPRLRDDALTDARLYPDREAMIQALAKGSTGGEVGVQRGNFARFMLDHLDMSTLHLFERNIRLIRDDVLGDPRCILHHGPSAKRLREMPEASFDWLYIDADHSYEGVRKDIAAAMDRVRPGGLLIFNDYTPWSMAEAMPYGVMAAVNETVNRHGLDVVGVALTPTGYLDIALRR